MARRVLLRHQTEIIVPIQHGLVAHQVVFIGEGPPHVPESRQPGHGVPQIGKVGFPGHVRKSPAVVGMEQNQVRLNAHFPQLTNALFQMPPVFRVKFRKIPLIAPFGFAPGEGEMRRVVGVVEIMLGENAHANLVEGPVFQGFQGLVFHLLPLMGPAIAGGAHAGIVRAVGVGQPGQATGFFHHHRAVSGGGAAFEGSGLSVQLRGVGSGFIPPRALAIEHHPQAVAAFSVIKATHPHPAVAAGKFRGEFHRLIRVLPVGAGKPPGKGFPLCNGSLFHGQAPFGIILL